jgi:thiamine kinase-like enzyme
MIERRSYWVSAGMAFANPVKGGIHCREVLTDEDASQSSDEYARMYCDLHKKSVQMRHRNVKLVEAARDCLELLEEWFPAMDDMRCASESDSKKIDRLKEIVEAREELR